MLRVRMRFEIVGDDNLKRKGTTYILALGVNHYSNTSFNLNYAVPDAQIFGKVVGETLNKTESHSENRSHPVKR